jgi:hypothetical protein
MRRRSGVRADGISTCSFLPESLEARTALCGTTATLDSAILDRVAQAQDTVAAQHQPVGHEVTAAGATGRHAARSRAHVAPPPIIVAANLTTPTMCAEEDNVNVPLFLPTSSSRFSFTIDARHPAYEVTEDHRDPDFSSCPPTVLAGGGAQQIFPIHDDHISTAIVAVRDPDFHQPGMRVRVGGASVAGVHFIRVIRRIAGTDSWPEVMVLYSDGNLRLKPQAPPAGGDAAFGTDPVFGSSVIVGPAPVGERPVAGIKRVAYDPSKQVFNVRYAAGRKATLRLVQADRGLTRVRVVAHYAASPHTPFATVRSMYVADGNADVDSVNWSDASGAAHLDTIGGFQYGQGGQFLFGRTMTSRHNTSAPDILVGGLTYAGR